MWVGVDLGSQTGNNLRVGVSDPGRTNDVLGTWFPHLQVMVTALSMARSWCQFTP